MDIGKHKDDFTYYDGYEGEGEVILTVQDISYHIWDGYFEDIFGNPISEESRWEGFTRDYNEFINGFDEKCVECAIIPGEYLKDAKRYIGKSFSYDETVDILNCLITILKKAEEKQECVFVKVN